MFDQIFSLLKFYYKELFHFLFLHLIFSINFFQLPRPKTGFSFFPFETIGGIIYSFAVDERQREGLKIGSMIDTDCGMGECHLKVTKASTTKAAVSEANEPDETLNN